MLMLKEKSSSLKDSCDVSSISMKQMDHWMIQQAKEEDDLL